MKHLQTIKKDVAEKAVEFTTKLNGRFKEFVSDKFIQVYLVDEFEAQIIPYMKKEVKPDPLNVAYNAAVSLFEYKLEHGCGAICNGHHVAQTFAEYFKGYNFDQ